MLHQLKAQTAQTTEQTTSFLGLFRLVATYFLSYNYSIYQPNNILRTTQNMLLVLSRGQQLAESEERYKIRPEAPSQIMSFSTLFFAKIKGGIGSWYAGHVLTSILK
jgi:hypothetical protein